MLVFHLLVIIFIQYTALISYNISCLSKPQERKFTKRYYEKGKHGGLDSRDQSRSRSRTSIVSRLTFENGRDYPSRQDQFFFISVEIFKIETFQSRFRCVKIFIEIVETNQDFRDKSRFSRYLKVIEIFSR